MSNLNVDQKTIKDLFQGRRVDFLIPDYQRPYAWGVEQCQTLWEDIFSFAFPDEGRTGFDINSEYFLGPIVTFKNEEGRMEVIDGQQRLTTLMLLLRAFYSRFQFMQDESSVSTRRNIEQCIWKTDEFGKPDKENLKIDSEVATDNDKDEFLEILRTGEVKKEKKSRYAKNFGFFADQTETFLTRYPTYFALLATRIMNNCILLPIEAKSQDTALRIFSTLNDRGLPLSDSDIFKAQFYKFYSSIGKKDDFIKRWKELEELCEKIFHPLRGTPMDELFTRYMYFLRAKMGIKSSTTEALRKFYEREGYSVLKKEETFENLITLAHFWEDVQNQDRGRFSDNILRRLFVLNCAPNGMWTYFVSVYFMQMRDKDDKLEEEAFAEFLDKTIGFIWTYSLVHPGVISLRTPIFAEMVNIVTGKTVTFSDFLFDRERVRDTFSSYTFTNNRNVTRSVLTWWALEDPRQSMSPLEKNFDIEHIYARRRQSAENALSDPRNIDALGNKVLLESRINIRASDYRFADKKRCYSGYVNDKGREIEGTGIQELLDLVATHDDFTEQDIIARTNKIIGGFIAYLQRNGLLEN